MLQNYYDESSELLREYEQEWIRDLAYFHQVFSETPIAESEQQDTTAYPLSNFLQDAPDISAVPIAGEESSKKMHPEWAKKLFRKIAKITHPDRAAPEDEGKLSKLFRRASDAFNEEDHEELLSLALDLGVPFDINAPELKSLLEKRIEDLKRKITKLEEEIPWVWGEGFGLIEIRAKLLGLVLSNTGVKVPHDDLIEEIKKRELADA